MQVLDRLTPLPDRPASTLSLAARLGLATHGVLYVVIGLLALEVARRGGGEEADGVGAVEAVADRSYGWTLVARLVVGLLALVLWRAVQTLRGDPVSGSGLRDRVVYGTKAVAYLSVAAASVRVLAGDGAGNGEEEARSLTADLLAMPYGRWVVAGAGFVVAMVGVRNFVRHAMRAEFCSNLDHGRVGEHRLALVRRVGQVGYAARSVVFVLVGTFLVEAALTFDPSQTRGLSGALHELARQPWGRPVLWAVAAGLVFYGLLSLLLARYRRVA